MRLVGVMMLLLAPGCGTNRIPKGDASDSDAQASSVTDPASPSFHSLDTPRATTSVPRAARAGDWFEDVTDRSGVRFSYHNGREAGLYTIVETVGGGVAMISGTTVP